MKMKIVRGSSLSIPVAILLISLPFLVVLCGASSSPRILEIKYVENGNRIFWTHVWPGDRFSLEYVHSVQLSRVTDGFEIDSQYDLVLTGTTFSDHGAGLPYKPNYGGAFSVLPDGRFNISGMNMVLPEILLRTGSEHDNVFECGNRRINLSRQCGDALLVISTRKYSTLGRLFRKLVNVE
ncbi:DUF1850 domain-containing protein [Candidatus Poribacteria bacterium]